MGGVVPLGCDVRDRKLIVNEAEAARVRITFQRYVDLGSIGDLATELAERSMRSKRGQRKDGRIVGGTFFSKGAIAQILQNPLYHGEISHRGEQYPGQHDAIIDADLWQQVQDRLAAHRVAQTLKTRATAPSLLAGMLFDPHRRPMTPSHAVKHGKRYRYYISRVKPSDTVAPLRLAAGEIEAMLISSVVGLLRDRRELADACNGDATALQALFAWAAAQADLLDTGGQSARRRLLLELRLQTVIGDAGITITLVTPAGPLEHGLQVSPARIRSEMHLVLSADERGAGIPDAALIGLLVRAHQAHAS